MFEQQAVPNGEQIISFEGGITFTIPYQGFPVTVIQKDLYIEPGPSEGFIPIRIIGNFAVQNLENNELLRSFDPPITIDVGYLLSDKSAAFRFKQTLRLAYHDGKNWQVFNAIDHKFRLLPSSTAMFGEVVINEWSADPPVAWGR